MSKMKWKGPFLIMSELLKVKASGERERNNNDTEKWLQWFYCLWLDTDDLWISINNLDGLQDNHSFLQLQVLFSLLCP